MKERRKLKRFIFEVPAKIEVVTSPQGRRMLELLSSNICSGGAFFPTTEALPEGTELKIDFKLPLDRLRDLVDCSRVNVKVHGTVVRSESTGMAVSFSSNYQILPN